LTIFFYLTISGFKFSGNLYTYFEHIADFYRNHPVLSSQKGIPNGALVMKSGIFWPALDKNLVGCYLEIHHPLTGVELVGTYAQCSEGFVSLDSSLSYFLVIR
jgi:hypothetical protein